MRFHPLSSRIRHLDAACDTGGKVPPKKVHPSNLRVSEQALEVSNRCGKKLPGQIERPALANARPILHRRKAIFPGEIGNQREKQSPHGRNSGMSF